MSYGEFSNYYDYYFAKGKKNYLVEAEKVKRIIKKFKPNAKTILDVACGTGEHDKYLKEHFIVEGLDINPTLLKTAKKKNRECIYYEGNMINFDFKKKYDIIICLFSSIGYVLTVENLKKCIKCMANHLNKNGMIILEPWFTPTNWRPSIKYKPAQFRGYEFSEISIVKMAHSQKINNNISKSEEHFLIGTKNEIRYFKEVFEHGLFTREEMTNAFEEAELEVRYDNIGLIGRGLYLADKK